MDCSSFVAEIDGLFVSDLAEGRPKDARFAAIAEDVAGFCTPAELAVVNAAARSLPEGEAYLEVGTFKGRSICAAALDAPGRRLYAVENFQEFGMLSDSARDELQANLRRHTSGASLRLLEGDCFRLLAHRDAIAEPVGVYFYDGAHTWLSHYLALGVVEPLLADEALVLVDDASWPVVQRATRAYVARHQGWEVLRDIRAEHDHDPRWANGLMVLRWARPAGKRSGRRMSWDVRVLRVVQTQVVGRWEALAWRALHRFRWLVPVARRLVPKRSRTVPERPHIGTR